MPSAKASISNLRNKADCSVKKPSVLLYDSHLVFCQGVRALLDPCPELDLVAYASSEDQFQQAIKEHSPDVVVVSTSSEVRVAFAGLRARPFRKLVFWVGDINDDVLQACLNLDPDGILTKKDPVDKFISDIKKICESNGKHFSRNIRARLVTKRMFDPKLESVSTRRSLLSPREIEVLCCVARGMKARIISDDLQITTKTVERHKSNIMAKLGLRSQVDLALYAVREGFISLA